MKIFKKVSLVLMCASAMCVGTAFAASPSDNTLTAEQAATLAVNELKKDGLIKEKNSVNRAKVNNIKVELELPDGSILTLDDMDFCTPGGFYNGVEALVFGDEAVKIMQAGMAALYPKVGDSVNRMWNNKVNASDPRLPTYLMIKAPEGANNKKKAANTMPEAFKSSASIMKVDKKTPSVMATCGGYNHPPN